MNQPLPPLLPQEFGQAKNLRLKDFTFARIGLGKKGFGIPLREVLTLKASHAAARDAIFVPFDSSKIKEKLAECHIAYLELLSSAPDRITYLQRPDKGRLLSPESSIALKNWRKDHQPTPIDVAIVVADGLSALAVNAHVVGVLQMLFPKLQQAGYSLAPIILLHQGRVAAADPIGEILGAKLSLILLGERPGLSSPDSLGAYLTFGPKTGLTDESRNCISNIRPQGLPLEMAAEKLFYLINESLRRRISGVGLKDEFGLLKSPN